ncbi:tyrosine-type recombinase/integrase [Cryobacterium sp. SO1]|uniref:tyrosine-type recombinase/integrase n=2 Tax=Microbacteriaceae TaxID=85023 RepID=UPI0013EEBF12|nr:tyrosine-type recombinase/integrase [Cryobacterium sp. SO1]
MALRSHRVRQTAELEEARSHGHAPPAQFADLVFTTSIGTPLEPSNLRRDFDALTATPGLRRIRFHDLRHACASLLFAQSVPPRVVMDLLGHSTLSITTDLYAHVMPSTLTDAATAMDDILGSNR